MHQHLRGRDAQCLHHLFPRQRLQYTYITATRRAMHHFITKMLPQFLLLVALCSAPLASAIDGIDFDFRSDPNTPRALLATPGIPQGMTQFTFCFRMLFPRERNLKDVNPVSYSSEEARSTNEILAEIDYRNNFTALYINDAKADVFGIVPPSDTWTFVCYSWASATGEVRFHFDGTEVGRKSGTKVGHVIGGKGYLVLGQDQDQYDGGYGAENGVTGRMTQFHLWDRVLTADEVKAVGRCELTGNVVDWHNSTWSLSERLIVAESTAPACTQGRKGNTPPSFVRPTVSQVVQARVTAQSPVTTTTAASSGWNLHAWLKPWLNGNLYGK